MIDPLLVPEPGTKNYTFNGHAGAGPSASERWLSCTASLGASRAFLETLTESQRAEFADAGSAARQGTTAHAVAETHLRRMTGEIDDDEANVLLTELSVMPESGEEYDDEMEDFVSEHVDLVKQYIDAGHKVLIEHRVGAHVALQTLDEDGDRDVYTITGSADVIVLPTPDVPVLTVIDLKYGVGHDVSAEGNTQARIYGLGALSELANEDGEVEGVEEVEYVITQPRLGGIKTSREPIASLLEWADTDLSIGLTEALGGHEGGAKFKPSESACQWCPARGGCAALAESVITGAAELFDAVIDAEMEGADMPDASLLTDERLGSLYLQGRQLAALTDKLKEEIQLRMMRGHAVPGMKMVSYTPPRAWSNDAAHVLEENEAMWVRKLVTPTQALKVAKSSNGAIDAEKIEALVVAPAKRPVVAPATDRRKEWVSADPDEMFKEN